jgi:type VI secretion system secreted protein VgrG
MAAPWLRAILGETFMPDTIPVTITTPSWGKDVFQFTGLTGQEGISQLFTFQIDLLADSSKEIAFDQLLGQKVTVTMKMPKDKERYFSGVCVRVSQGASDFRFTAYRLELVPQFWLLTRNAQSRIFQNMTVIDILKKVLTGLDVSWKVQGKLEPRDYCVQYRETDFNFASRLMEEEGLFYFFTHSKSGHQMVVADNPASHPDVPNTSRVIFDSMVGGGRDEGRIWRWEKVQEIRAGKYTLWDHCFELPHKHLEAEKATLGSVAVGQVTHKLKVGNDNLELYDWPGEYAQRFDGVNSGGGDQPDKVQKIFDDNKRTVEIRMQQEALPGLIVHGASDVRDLVSGHKFTFVTQPDDRVGKLLKADGPYIVTSVTHFASWSQEGAGFQYQNTFTCIPFALPFRPPRTTPKPFVQGTQTAVVVGPSGEEIFTDKYGRVKVQFHWDRQGKNDANSSCWLRVSTFWASKQWGTIHIPRIGMEVLVSFLEGDPDQPIVVGCVYNADMMPPFKLPDKKTQSGIRTRSTLKGGPDNCNELHFEDLKGSEDIFFHAEKDFHREVENDDDLKVGHDQTIAVKNNRTETVKEGNEKVTIEKGTRTLTVQGDDTHEIKQGNRQVTIDMGNDTLAIKMGNQTTKLDLGASSTEAMQSITLKVGQNSITIDQMGVTIKGMMISVEGQIQTAVKGLMTQINGSAMLQLQGGITMIG